MDWKSLSSSEQFGEILQKSRTNGDSVAIFKHSTRCSISSVAKSRLERNWKWDQEFPLYYLDLLSYREVSNAVAKLLEVEHESPQLIVIKNGEVIHTASHQAINALEAQEAV